MKMIAFNNVFDAVTDTAEEAAEMQTRSGQMLAIGGIIEEKGWKQTEAAERLGLRQLRVSDLINGKIEPFSVDLLITCLYRIGFRLKPRYENNQLTMQVIGIQQQVVG